MERWESSSTWNTNIVIKSLNSEDFYNFTSQKIVHHPLILQMYMEKANIVILVEKWIGISMGWWIPPHKLEIKAFLLSVTLKCEFFFPLNNFLIALTPPVHRLWGIIGQSQSHFSDFQPAREFCSMSTFFIWQFLTVVLIHVVASLLKFQLLAWKWNGDAWLWHYHY